MAERAGYAPAQIVLHWLVALGVLANWLLSGGMEDAFKRWLETREFASPMAPVHVAVGMAVLALVLVRLVLRWRIGAPAQAEGLLGRLAALGHGLLYLLLLVVPVLGAAAWIGGIQGAGAPHHLLANALLLLVLLHSLAALFHHYVLKDGTMRRMSLNG